ncbi:putative bifunctional diguanylate cyclase/phosphodiesterase [Quatrionicoccus australiensis]|uniref:putative bifunctional diguanylate cyclase/phosphodiesterase n=1 Tax=Quatrionicoccus australiensis TaxID=138118 RepID=UPI001CFC2222|nr:GGDEF domain-containing phosphodiesterase [Quatrionicoccus australiensis]MCB4361372.1 EAL domain-containing protein [Quatrionicoccus australiensis]
MQNFWQRSLLGRTVGNIIVITFLVGGLIMLAMSISVARQTEADAYRRLGELLDTVEDTVRVACFVGNEELAMEVARGLLRNSEVQSVDIRYDKGLLAHLERNPADGKQAVLGSQPVRRNIVSPFDNSSIVGNIALQPDGAAIETLVAQARRQIALQTLLLIIAVAIALTLTVLRQVVKPIAVLSKNLNKLDPILGEQLSAPAGHEKDAFGSLTRDINALSSRLLNAAEVERELNVRHEMDQRKYRDIFENAESGIFIADAFGEMTSYNRSLAQLTGLPQPAADETAPRSLLALPWTDAGHLQKMIERCIKSNAAVVEDLALLRSMTPQRWLNVALTPIGACMVQGIVSDVTTRRNAELAAKRAAITDPLTGLANRQGFEEFWANEIAKVQDQHFALLLIDLEGFKQLNDALGFPAGDRVLIGFAARIFSCIKNTDWVARVGGDEFAVVLPNIDEPGKLDSICQRILRVLGERFSVSGQETCLGASIGATLYPDDGNNLPALLRNAELALNDARHRGGQIWSLFNQDMRHAIEHRHNLANDLRLAIQRQELRLYYQPIVHLASQRVVGAEALIRWQHPTHGLVPPDNFIPLAEQTGMINAIGLWCLETACQQLADWQAAGLDLSLTVNVSARQIPDGLSPAKASEIAAHHGIAPQRLGLEITEGLLIGEAHDALRWLEAIRTAGFRVYLDDFGTGYSSLSYLKRFRVDTVKIDKAFIRDMGQVASDRVMIEAVIMMADALRLSVVAEGIETAEQRDLLRSLGCTYGQGYLYSRPLPIEQFLAQVLLIDAPATPT